MPQSENDRVREEFLKHILGYIYAQAENVADAMRDAATDTDPNELKKRLINLQSGVAYYICGLLDGVVGPTEWDGVKLVNAETDEALTDFWQSAWSHAEGDFLDRLDSASDK